MGSYRYEEKRQLNLVEIPETAIEGSFGAIIKANDLAKFGGGALFETWSGLPTGTPITAGSSVNSNDYHPNGAVWMGAATGVSAGQLGASERAVKMVGDYINLNSGTATTNSVTLGAYKPFYINRHSTWNGTIHGIVFEALVGLPDYSEANYNAFIGMVNKADPGASVGASPAYTLTTSSVNRWGIGHNGTANANLILCTVSSSGSAGVTFSYLGTSTHGNGNGTASIFHFKIKNTTTKYTSAGTSYETGLEYFINDTLVDVVLGSSSAYPSRGNYPYYPVAYVESLGASGVIGHNMNIYGIKISYF